MRAVKALIIKINGHENKINIINYIYNKFIVYYK